MKRLSPVESPPTPQPCGLGGDPPLLRLGGIISDCYKMKNYHQNPIWVIIEGLVEIRVKPYVKK